MQPYSRSGPYDPRYYFRDRDPFVTRSAPRPRPRLTTTTMVQHGYRAVSAPPVAVRLAEMPRRAVSPQPAVRDEDEVPAIGPKHTLRRKFSSLHLSRAFSRKRWQNLKDNGGEEGVSAEGSSSAGSQRPQLSWRTLSLRFDDDARATNDSELESERVRSGSESRQQSNDEESDFVDMLNRLGFSEHSRGSENLRAAPLGEVSTRSGPFPTISSPIPITPGQFSTEPGPFPARPAPTPPNTPTARASKGKEPALETIKEEEKEQKDPKSEEQPDPFDIHKAPNDSVPQACYGCDIHTKSRRDFLAAEQECKQILIEAGATITNSGYARGFLFTIPADAVIPLATGDETAGGGYIEIKAYGAMSGPEYEDAGADPEAETQSNPESDGEEAVLETARQLSLHTPTKAEMRPITLSNPGTPKTPTSPLAGPSMSLSKTPTKDEAFMEVFEKSATPTKGETEQKRWPRTAGEMDITRAQNFVQRKAAEHAAKLAREAEDELYTRPSPPWPSLFEPLSPLTMHPPSPRTLVEAPPAPITPSSPAPVPAPASAPVAQQSAFQLPDISQGDTFDDQIGEMDMSGYTVLADWMTVGGPMGRDAGSPPRQQE